MKTQKESKSSILPQTLKKASWMTGLQVQACQGVRGGQKNKGGAGNADHPNIFIQMDNQK